MSWDILPKSNLQYFLQKLKEKFDLKADKEEVEESDTTNTTPFLYRQTPHNADRVFLDELVGGSVAWNQLVQNGDFASKTKWQVAGGSYEVANNIATFTCSGDANRQLYQFITIPVSHVVYVSCYVKPSVTAGIYLRIGSISGSPIVSCPANTWTKIEGLKTIANEDISGGQVEFNIYSTDRTALTSGTTIQVKEAYLDDLTQWFGSSDIPNYAYTLEQSTAGSGIAWLKSHGFFTKDYYPYNTGELISVKTSGKKYVGKNKAKDGYAYDVTANGTVEISSLYNSCIAYVESGKTYTHSLNGSKTNIGVIAFFSDLPEVGSVSYNGQRQVNIDGTFTAPISGYVIIRNPSSETKIQIEQGSTATAYEPYTEKTYDISNIDLRGIPKLVNNELVYDGDTYDSNGDVNRKYGIVDLGSLEWSYDATQSHPFFYTTGLNALAIDPDRSEYSDNILLCAEYMVAHLFVSLSDANWADASTNKSMTFHKSNPNYIYIRDDTYADAAIFKTAMSGVYLVYELATPTTETTDPYTNPQICDKDGTEEFIDDRTVPIPVGHNSRYADLPSIMDGDYLSYMARNFASEEYVDTELDTKVDKVSGKGLSTNDYTNEEKALVATIPNKADADDVAGTQTVSGNPITLTDAAPINAESLVVELEPKQDLHGYDFPWVGGAGKNKLNLSDYTGNSYAPYGFATTISGEDVTITLTDFPLTSATESFEMLMNTDATFDKTGLSIKAFVSAGGNYVSGVRWSNVYNNNNIAIDLQNLSQGLNATITMRVMVYETSGGEPTTYSPYENICPITGYTECEVDDCGKNLFDISAVKTVEDYNGNSRYGVEIDFVGAITVKANGTTQTGYLSAYVLKVDGTKAQYNYIVSDSTFYTRTFIVSSGEKLVMVHELNDQEETAIWRMTNWLIQAEIGSTATPYEPYKSSNASIQFGKTVYGGRSYFTDGVTDDELACIDLGSLDWTYDASEQRFYSGLIADKKDGWLNDNEIMCSCFEPDRAPVTGASVDGTIAVWDRCYVKYFESTDATAFKTMVTGQELTYPLATPNTLATPKTDLKLLKGTNNITSNGTTINLGYQPDNVIGDTLKVAEDYTDRVMESIGSDVVANISGTITYSGETISLKAVKFKNGVKFLYISCFGFPKVSSVIGINGFLTSEFYPSNPINVDADLVAFDNSNNPFRVTIGKTNGTIYIYGAPDDGIELRGIYM